MTAVLTVDAHAHDEIELPLGEQVLISSCFTSTPSCPFTCKLHIENEDIVKSFDKYTGDLVVYNNDYSICDTEIDFTITCTSTLSGSKATYESWISIPSAEMPDESEDSHQSHSHHHNGGKGGKSGSHGHGNHGNSGHGNSGSHHGENPGSGHKNGGHSNGGHGGSHGHGNHGNSGHGNSGSHHGGNPGSGHKNGSRGSHSTHTHSHSSKSMSHPSSSYHSCEEKCIEHGCNDFYMFDYEVCGCVCVKECEAN
jgi:hypothetical protein